jgi:4'-phosphopantetheinyl transferase
LSQEHWESPYYHAVTGPIPPKSPILKGGPFRDLPDGITLRYATAVDEALPSVIALTAKERERLATFGRVDRQRSFILGRTAARTLLAERLGCDPAAVPLVIIADGALDVPNHPLRVSIAHTGTGADTLALAGIAEQPVGVDLERIVPRLPDLYRRILHSEEYPLLDTLGLDHDAAQVLLWSLKEAVLKGLQTGFQRAAQSVRLSEVHDGCARADTGDDSLWTLRYARRNDVWITVAWR